MDFVIKFKNKKLTINISAILLIAFIVLKLFGLINWSWWWVLVPLWLPICCSIAVVAIGTLVVFISYLFTIIFRKN